VRHGTITAYSTYDCRCAECGAAWRAYSRQWARERRAGRKRLRDVGAARDHLLRLVAAGHTSHSIESISGISDSALLNILSGKTKRVRHATAEAILGLTLDERPGPHNFTSSVPARRLLAEMRGAGFPAGELAAVLGYKPSISSYAPRGERILMRNHRRVCVLYELLARQGAVPAAMLEEVGA
jgi:hypothetical protein